MQLSRFGSLTAGVSFAFALVACSVSTSHIGSLKLGKDKDISAETTTFAPQDGIYAKATGDNLAGKVTINWQTIAENVKGQPPNSAISSLDKSFDMEQDGTADYDLTPPAAGWPAGTYKIVVTMMDNGAQRDQKTQEFTVGAAGQ